MALQSTCNVIYCANITKHSILTYIVPLTICQFPVNMPSPFRLLSNYLYEFYCRWVIRIIQMNLTTYSAKKNNYGEKWEKQVTACLRINCALERTLQRHCKATAQHKKWQLQSWLTQSEAPLTIGEMIPVPTQCQLSLSHYNSFISIYRFSTYI